MIDGASLIKIYILHVLQGWIPSHIPSFQLWFLALCRNVSSTFPYVQKFRSHNHSCNSSITNLCRWDCTLQPHSKHGLLEIPRTASPLVSTLQKESNFEDVQLEYSVHRSYSNPWTHCACLSGKLGTPSLHMLELETGMNPELYNTVSNSINYFFLYCIHKFWSKPIFLLAWYKGLVYSAPSVIMTEYSVLDYAAWFGLLLSSSVC